MPQAAHSAKTRSALFLDRDGTIIRDMGYLSDPDGVELLDGAKEALQRVCASHHLYLFTNQSGIGRGYYTLEQAQAVNARMMELLALPSRDSWRCASRRKRRNSLPSTASPRPHSSSNASPPTDWTPRSAG